MSATDPVHQQIESIVTADEVVLFMKGNRSFPQCGFSATVVQILDSMLGEYKTVNVLSDPGIRQGIKDYSNWPTIPQLYIKGEFLGGCDIIREMHSAGELSSALGVNVGEVAAPEITITEAAATELRNALVDADAGDVLHLSVNTKWEHGLDMGPAGAASLVVESSGIKVAVNKVSAARANGVVIDFIERPGGGGFKIDNPNAPAQIHEISPKELQGMLASGEVTEVFDVRTAQEREICSLDNAPLFDDAVTKRLEGLPKTTPLAFICHHGGRSRSAADHFRKLGFTKLYNLAGGLDAWAQEVDTSMKRY